jgi:tetratricopeptide (TPR) repeat protein
MTPAECYRLLGLPNGAPYDAVKLAYRRRARLLHPDINTHDRQASEKFIQITAAYQKLIAAFPTSGPAPEPPKPQLTADQQLKQTAYKQLQHLLRGQRMPRAIALVDALAQRLPEDPEIKQWQGIVYQRWARSLIQSGGLDKAQAYLMKALNTDPHNQSLLAEVEQDLRQIKRINQRQKTS